MAKSICSIDEEPVIEGIKKRIDDIYQRWNFVGVDENGYDTFLPLTRKAIKYSKNAVKEIERLNPDDEEKGHLSYIRKVTKSAMKRKMRASWKVIIICLVLAALWGWQLGAFDQPGEIILEKEGQELAVYFNERMSELSNDIVETTNEDIPETKAEIESKVEKIKAGFENDDLKNKAEKDLKKEKDHLKFLENYLDEKTELYNRQKDMTPENYKADLISIGGREQINAWISMGFWGVLVLLYIISTRRPYFLFWKKSFDEGTLSVVDDVGSAVVSSALISSLVNFESNSTEYVKWSDGTVTKETDLTGGGMNIIFAIVIAMFYALFIVVTLPLRIIWNWLRNYLLYF